MSRIEILLFLIVNRIGRNAVANHRLSYFFAHHFLGLSSVRKYYLIIKTKRKISPNRQSRSRTTRRVGLLSAPETKSSSATPSLRAGRARSAKPPGAPPARCGRGRHAGGPRTGRAPIPWWGRRGGGDARSVARPRQAFSVFSARAILSAPSCRHRPRVPAAAATCLHRPPTKAASRTRAHDGVPATMTATGTGRTTGYHAAGRRTSECRDRTAVRYPPPTGRPTIGRSADDPYRRSTVGHTAAAA